MERELAKEKIASLDGLLRSSSLAEDERRDLQDRLESLKHILDPQAAVTKREGEIDWKEAQTTVEEGKEDQKGDEAEDEEIFVGELSSEETAAIEELESFFKEFAAEFGDILPEIEEDTMDLAGDLANAMAGNITREDLDALKYFKGGVDSTLNIFGMKGLLGLLEEKDGILDELRMQNEVFGGNSSGAADIAGILPDSMASMDALREAGRLTDADIAAFVDEAGSVLRDVFTLTSKPRNVGYGYLLEGKPRVDGDALVAALDSLAVSSGGGALERTRCYYVRDVATANNMNEIEIADAIGGSEDVEDVDIQEILARVAGLAPPALLVLPRDLAPRSTNRGVVLWATSVLGLCSILRFAVDCYGDSGESDSFSMLLADPTMIIGLFSLALVHELGHLLVAGLNGVKLTFPPALLPSVDGLAITSSPQILTSPKNGKALFDIALGGPIVGLVASWLTLVYGLRQTALPATVAQIAALPHVPLKFLQLSSLTSATIESFLGTDTLLSIDPLAEPSVAVHPLLVVGHLGILANGLALLPNRNTSDGGRMARGAFSRESAQILPPLASLFLFVQAFRTWGVSSMLAVYILIGGGLEDNNDVPCRNDVDPASGWRAVTCIASCIVAAVVVSPAF